MSDVIIKKNVEIPPLLLNCIDFGFTTPTQYLKPDDASIDTRFEIRLDKTGRNTSTTVEFERFRIILPEQAGFMVPDNPEIKSKMLESIPHVKTIKITGPYIVYLKTFQNPYYLAAKFVGVVKDMITMAFEGMTPRELDFTTRFSNGNIFASMRHGAKPEVFDIPWHRNSDNFGEYGRGFIVSSLYIHRPASILPQSGGIYFVKGNRQVNVFPQAGTVVTFFDQNVIHRVIPIKVRSNSETSNGFVQRSAVFISWLTDNAHIEQGVNKNIFLKHGISHKFRDLQELYDIVDKYIQYIQRQYRTNSRYVHMSVPEFLRQSSNSEIEHVYQGVGHTVNNSQMMERLRNITKTRNKTVADMILYDMYASPKTIREKMYRLYAVYEELKLAFGDRTNVSRRGRTLHTPLTSGFITNIG
jgi:hypothetical protein